jgi:UDP-N-acetylmuramate-alanine ligase
VVTEVYAAREAAPEDGFSARQLAESIAGRRGPDACVKFTPGLDDAVRYLAEIVRAGDAVLVLSAGDADQINTRLGEELVKRRSTREEERRS